MKDNNKVKKASFGSVMRRRLSDITNSGRQRKSSGISENLQFDSASAKDYIEHLVKEKMALVKLIQDKNKLIELSGAEIQNMKTCIQKMQLQNWSLAQTNSQMLAELNTNKDRIKALHHEIVCKEAVLRAKYLQVMDHQEVNIQKTEVQDTDSKTKSITHAIKCKTTSRRDFLSRSRSLGSSNVSDSDNNAEEEVLLRKRRCSIRKSTNSRAKHEKEEAEENLFEIDDIRFPANDNLVIREQRSSISRPMRRVVKKIESYKERPLNTKMRRAE